MDDILSNVYEKYLPTVRSIAGQMNAKTPNRDNMQDFTQSGWLGVFKAIRSYDESKGALNTHVSRCIRYAIIDFQRSVDPLNKYERASVRRLRNAINELRNTFLREPTAKEVMCFSGMAQKDYEKARILSVAGNDDAGEDRLYSTDPTPVKLLIEDALHVLNDRELYVIRGRYWVGKSGVSMSKEMGLSGPRINQIHNKALSRLRREMNVTN